jgi:hypothetical protein
MKYLVLIVVVLAFLVMVKFAASLLVWLLHLLFAWLGLVVILLAFLYLAYKHFFK